MSGERPDREALAEVLWDNLSQPEPDPRQRCLAAADAVLALVAALPQGRDEADRATCGARIDLGPRIHAVCSLPVLHNGPHSDAAAPAPRDDTATLTVYGPHHAHGCERMIPHARVDCTDARGNSIPARRPRHDTAPLECLTCSVSSRLGIDLAAARSEAAGLRAEVDRLRTRVHEAVDECQRRYAPSVKELARLLGTRNQARTYFEGTDDAQWWFHTSEISRAYIADLIDQCAGARQRLAAVEAVCAEWDEAAGGPFAATDEIRAALAAEAAPTEASPAPAPGDEAP